MCKSEASLNVNISSTSSQVSIYLDNGKREEWYFYGKRDSKRFEMEDTTEGIDKTIETGTSRKVLHFARTSENSFGCDSNCIENVVGFIKHISTVHNAPVHYLNVHLSKLHHLEAIQSVDVLRKSKNVKINEGTVSHEEMRRILEGFENEALVIHCHPDPSFTYDRPISIQYLTVQNGFWFKGPMLLNINCENWESLTVFSPKIAQEHINMFLHKWLNETISCGKIKHLWVDSRSPASESVYHDSRPPKWDLEKMVQGLSSFEQPLQPPKRRYSRQYGRKIDGPFIYVRQYPNFQACDIYGSV